MEKTKHKLIIDSLSNADIATVYFFFHKEAELHYEAFRKATNSTIKKVMELTIPKSEQEAIQLGTMEKPDRMDWLTQHLADNETINALLMLVDNVTQFKSELDKDMPLLPKKPERKQVIPEAVFNMGSPRFPHTRESENGAVKVLNTSDNLAELLAHYGYTLRTNLMTLERELFYYGQRASQTVEESRSLIISLASMAGLPKAAIDDHLDALAKVESYHPVKLTLDTSGEWDGIKRVDNVIACLNAKVPEMANSVIKKWLVGCVASLYEPRFKSKLVPILQGAQSYRKTAFVERMATILENSFLEGAELDPDKKDNVISCVKSWIVELGEMERTSKKEQGALKAFLTKETDTVRLPYARADIKKPRQTHFIGTVNDDSFLRDETGSSRYAVLEMAQAANMDLLNELLGWQWCGTGSYKLVDEYPLVQFWLEVKHLYQTGIGWHLNADELAMVATVNEKYSFKDSYYQSIEETFLSHLDDANYRMEWLTASNVCSLLELPKDRSRPMGRALKRLANERRINAKIARGVVYYELPRIDTTQ